MKDNTLVALSLIGAIGFVGTFASTTFLSDLARKQHAEQLSIGWIHGSALSFILFDKTPVIHREALNGPAIVHATLALTGDIVGGDASTVRPGTLSDGSFVIVHAGKVIQQNPDFIVQSQPEISQDDAVIAVIGKYAKSGDRGLFVLYDRGQRVVPISSKAQNPSWGATSAELAYEESGKVVIINLETRQQRKFADGNNPSWSPNGISILYGAPNSQWILAGSDGKSQRLLFKDTHLLSRPAWSPDSEYLTYVRSSTSAGFSTTLQCADALYEIVAYRVADGQRVRLIQTCGGPPDWYRDVKWIRIPGKSPASG